MQAPEPECNVDCRDVLETGVRLPVNSNIITAQQGCNPLHILYGFPCSASNTCHRHLIPNSESGFRIDLERATWYVRAPVD